MLLNVAQVHSPDWKMAAISAATGALPTSASQRQLLPTTLAGAAGRRRDRPPEPKVVGSNPAWRMTLRSQGALACR
jgi:hypothetical protein